MSSETVLIADDDPITQAAISKELRDMGFKALTASDGMQTLMYAMRALPAAIILDIKMPGGTGLDALKKLKSSSKTGSIPVIVLTGVDDPALEKTTAKMGAEAFLRKPLDGGLLRQTLARLLGERNQGFT